MIFAICTTIAAVLAGAAPGDTIRLTGDCPAVRISRSFAPAITVEAAGATVRGLTITGGGVVWRGGTIRAPAGVEGSGPAGYGLLVSAGRDVAIEGVRFIDSNRSIVLNNAVRVAVRFSRFELGQDGVIASGGSDLDVSHNSFEGVSLKLTSCTFASGPMIEGLSAAACAAMGGAWKDGWHQDAIQFRNGIKRLTIIGNRAAAVQQGIGQMDGATDAAVEGVSIDANDMAVTGFHSISTGNASDVRITGNRVAQTTGRRTLIRFRPGAVVCGNIVQRVGDPGAAPCL